MSRSVESSQWKCLGRNCRPLRPLHSAYNYLLCEKVLLVFTQLLDACIHRSSCSWLWEGGPSCGSSGEKRRSNSLAIHCVDKPLACHNESCERGHFVSRSSSWRGRARDFTFTASSSSMVTRKSVPESSFPGLSINCVTRRSTEAIRQTFPVVMCGDCLLH